MLKLHVLASASPLTAMVFGKSSSLLALSSLSLVIFSSLGTLPISVSASAHDGPHYHHIDVVKRAHDYDVIAKRWGDNAQYCKRRPSESTADSTGTAAATEEARSESSAASDSTATSTDDSEAPSESGTSSSNSSSSSTATGGGGGKLGIAWNIGDDPALANFATENVGYIYTWDYACPQQAKDLGLKCMPMLHSDNPDKIQGFQSTVVQGYAEIAMGFNEVNDPGQANMDVGSAVTAWKEYLDPLKDQGYQLISPSTNSAPDGIEWMRQFMSECSDCNIDGMSVHYYGTSAEEMITYVDQWKEFGKPIWITEYACTDFGSGGECDETQVREFHKAIAEYAASDGDIAAFFPFGFLHDMVDVNPLNQLMASDGSPTELGQAMIDLSL